jgi:hypothetical protein
MNMGENMLDINNYHLGFYLIGLLLFLLQEVPYMIMPFIKLKSNPIMEMKESSKVLNMLEKIFGTLSMIILFFVVTKGNNDIGFILMIVFLLLNYIGWFIYFKGYQYNWVMLLFIVMMPPLYYMSIGIWKENIILIIISIVFLFIHFTHVYKNLKE